MFTTFVTPSLRTCPRMHFLDPVDIFGGWLAGLSLPASDTQLVVL